MRTVWGRATSLNVQKVAWVLAETDLPYERIDVGGEFGGLDTQKYRAMNPNGRIPTLEDEGTILWESNAICRYLVCRYGGPLARETAMQTAQADMWMEWFQNDVHAAFMAMFRQMVRLTPDQRDETACAGSLRKIHQKFAIPEQVLEKSDFLLGDELTLADVPLAACLYRYFTLDIDQGNFPAIRAYYDRMTQNPAYRAFVMVDYSSLYGVQ